jgi:hypothetical protein
LGGSAPSTQRTIRCSTNLHTHGLIVEPRRADDASDPFGDYGFVVDLPPGVHPRTEMPGESVKVVEFDHAAVPTVCVQLGDGNALVTEAWVLVNLAAEDHNFHIHQTRFSVLGTSGGGTETSRAHDLVRSTASQPGAGSPHRPTGPLQESLQYVRDSR